MATVVFKVDRGVDVTIVESAAMRASPFIHAEHHRWVVAAAAVAGLRGREEPIRDNHLHTTEGGLVLQLPTQFTHAGIADGAGELAVAHHAFDAQILDDDRAVATGEPVAQVVQDGLALSVDAGVQLGNAELGSCSALAGAALGLTAELALQPAKTLQVGLEDLVGRHLGAIRQDRQVLDAEVHADDLAFRLDHWIVDNLHQHRGVELPGPLADRHLLGLAFPADGLAHGDAALEFLDPQAASIDGELRLLPEGERIAQTLLLEAGEARLLPRLHAAEEVGEGAVQVVDRVAGDAGRHIGVPGEHHPQLLPQLVGGLLAPFHAVLLEVSQ